MPAPTNNVIRITRPQKVGMFDRMARIADGLTSFVTGMGGDKDKLASAGFTMTLLTPMELEAAYRTDWISRKIIDIPPYDSTREWRAWQGDEDRITEIEDYEKRMGIQHKTMLAMQKARLYGGAALILGVNQGKNEDELDYEKLKADDLQFVHAVSRWDVSTGPMVRDIASPYFGEAEWYERAAAILETATPEAKAQMQRQGVKFHPSRVIKFDGMPRLDKLTSGEVWGDPVLQIVMEAVKAASLVTNSTAQLVAEAKVDVIKIPGLTEQIINTDYEARLNKRFSVANIVKGVYSMLLIDKEEEWERHNVTFTGLPDILNMYFLVASGAADIPATRFLGQSPAGMNATGESDIRNHYDAIGAKQRNETTPALVRLDNVLIPSAIGTQPDELFYVWNPLWQASQKEKDESNKLQAEVFQIDVNSGVLDSIVLKKARENQLIESALYPGFEQILDEFDGEGESAENPPEVPEVDPVTGLPRAANENANPDIDPDNEEGGAEDPATRRRPRRTADARAKLRAARMKPKAMADRRIFDGMASRMRFTDATPRTLYVRRELLNVKDIEAWARAQGFESILNDLHVTLIYSKERVDWVKVWSDPYDDAGELVIKAGGPRLIEQFGAATVLVFGSDSLTYRNMAFRYRGCSYDFEEYNPHITISYRNSPDRNRLIEAYQGELRFGPEIWEEINPSGFDEQDPKVERMFDGGQHRVVMQQGLDEDQVQALITAIVAKLPAPQVIVRDTDPPPDPNVRYKEVTVVTKHDADGRMLEFERRRVVDE